MKHNRAKRYIKLLIHSILTVIALESFSQAPPTAAFSSSNNNTPVCKTTCISFQDLSTDTPTSWRWSFPGGTPSSSSVQNPPNICYNVSGTYDVTLIVSNSFGSDTLTMPSFIFVDPTCPRPIPDFSANNTYFCSNTCIDYTDLSTNNPTSWRWIFPGGTPDTSSAQNPTNICYKTDGAYDVTLIASNQFGVDTMYKWSYIKVESVPGSFISPDTAIYIGEEVTLVAGGGTSYKWSDGSTTSSITVKPKETTVYKCIISDTTTKCQIEKFVKVWILYNYVFIPNSFHPTPEYPQIAVHGKTSEIATLHWIIYDRWGEKVFESTDVDMGVIGRGWDGTYKGKPCNTGAYVYTLNVTFYNGETWKKQGSITLLR